MGQVRQFTTVHRPVEGGVGTAMMAAWTIDRLRQPEHAVAIIEAKLPDLATDDGVDARLSRAETKIILWVVGAVIATGIASRFMPPPAAPTQSSPPIVIQIPTSTTTTPSAAAPAQK